MPLIQLVIVLLVIVFCFWLFNRYVTIDPTVKRIINAVAAILVILRLLNLFFGFVNIGSIHVGK